MYLLSLTLRISRSPHHRFSEKNGIIIHCDPRIKCHFRYTCLSVRMHGCILFPSAQPCQALFHFKMMTEPSRFFKGASRVKPFLPPSTAEHCQFIPTSRINGTDLFFQCSGPVLHPQQPHQTTTSKSLGINVQSCDPQSSGARARQLVCVARVIG